MSSRLIALVAVIVVAIGATIALTSKKTTVSSPASSSTTTPGNAAVATTNTVSIQGYAFAPAAITVKVGTAVTWTNQDAVQHSVSTDVKGSGPDSQLFGRAETYSYTFDKAGTYTYHCMPHTYMKGTVTVIQ